MTYQRRTRVEEGQFPYHSVRQGESETKPALIRRDGRKSPGIGESEPRGAFAAELEARLRDPNCADCPMHRNLPQGGRCMMGTGPRGAAGMVVVEAPSGFDLRFGRAAAPESTAGQFLDACLADAGVDRGDLWVTSAIKCTLGPKETRRADDLREAQKRCARYLEEELSAVRPRVVLAMGASPFYFFTHGVGIMKHRGQAFYDPVRGVWVVPTVSSSYVQTYPAFYGALISDLSKFRRILQGVDEKPRVRVEEVRDLEHFRRVRAEIDAHPGVVTFDVETRGFIDFLPEFAKVWCVGLSIGKRDPDGTVVSWIVPVEHPDSPFLGDVSELREVATGCCDMIERMRSNGHNVTFDLRNVRQMARRYAEASDEVVRAWAEEMRTKTCWEAPPLRRQLAPRGMAARPVKRTRKQILEDLLREAEGQQPASA